MDMARRITGESVPIKYYGDKKSLLEKLFGR